MVDYIRKKIRMFCYDMSWYWLFLWLSNKEEMGKIDEGLRIIEQLRNRRN